MKNKIDRISVIRDIVQNQSIGSQDELLAQLQSKGFDVTQATLSRDPKMLKVVKASGVDGNYVYVLWAEIPYQENYTNAANVVYSGVKTVNYTIGTMPVERGLVDITIQPVSYSTVGSSPTVIRSVSNEITG